MPPHCNGKNKDGQQVPKEGRKCSRRPYRRCYHEDEEEYPDVLKPDVRVRGIGEKARSVNRNTHEFEAVF